MPSNEIMCREQFTAREWLQYYKNIWTRNAISRAVDVKTDEIIKATNPEELVDNPMNPHGQPHLPIQIPVKERVEYRKLLVKDALDIIAGVDALLEIPEDQFHTKVLSEEALAVAPDMIKKEEEKKPEVAPEAAEPAAETPEAPEAPAPAEEAKV